MKVISPKIELPIRKFESHNVQYGAQKVVAEYCGLSNISHPIPGEWQHGWIAPERNIHPEFVIGSDGKSYERRHTTNFFVARQDQVDYLKSQGYEKVKAIGLPILYVRKPKIERIPGSLLIMPKHSEPDTEEEWNAGAYANYIKSIAPKFSVLYLCINKACADKGNWVQPFEKLNVQIVEGAAINDSNSLLRIALLLSRFEYVTSNSFGSLVAYASYFGCKVSVAGPIQAWTRKDLENNTLFKNSPKLYDIIDYFQRERVLEKNYSQFCCNPWEAILQQNWAAWQIGKQCMKNPKELKKIFCWNFSYKIKSYFRRILRHIPGAWNTVSFIRRIT